MSTVADVLLWGFVLLFLVGWCVTVWNTIRNGPPPTYGEIRQKERALEREAAALRRSMDRLREDARFSALMSAIQERKS